MIWYKYWFDSRWTFVAILAMIAIMTVFSVVGQRYDAASWNLQLEKEANKLNLNPTEANASLSNYRGYIWMELYQDWMLIVWPPFALAIAFLLIVGDCAFGISGITPQYTLALPITRRRLLSIAGVMGSLQLFALALFPALLLPVLSQSIGQNYPITNALSHAMFMTAGGLVFFSFSFFLATVFRKPLKGIFISVAVYILLWFSYRFDPTHDAWWNEIFKVMGGEDYILSGQIPWPGLSASLALASVLFYAAVRVYEARDF